MRSIKSRFIKLALAVSLCAAFSSQLFAGGTNGAAYGGHGGSGHHHAAHSIGG